MPEYVIGRTIAENFYTFFFLIILLILFLCFLLRRRKANNKENESVDITKYLLTSSDKVDATNIKVLFKMTSKDIMLAEKILTPGGKVVAGTDAISDMHLRVCAENRAALSFGFDKTNGTAYKILRIFAVDEIYYYKTDFKFMSKYIESNAEACAKYRNLSASTWKNYI